MSVSEVALIQQSRYPYRHEKLLLGATEWCALPELALPAIKARIDTGAKTSALHAFNIRPYSKGKHAMVRFDIHPLQASQHITITCHAPMIDERAIMSSNGHKEHRPVIRTRLQLNSQTWEIDITLSNRDPLKYRMLLGREAMGARVLIDPHRTYCQGKLTPSAVAKLYDNA